MDMSIILAVAVNVFSRIIFIACSIPLVRRRVKMNYLYGFRIPKAFESEENWYDINEYGAKQMIIWSILIILVGIIYLAIPISEAMSLIMGAGPITLAVLIVIIKTLIYANKL